MAITRREATAALLAVFQERSRAGTLLSGSEDYFNGSCERWSTVIAELSRSFAGGRILDVGALDGIFCSALKSLGYETVALDWNRSLPESVWKQLGIALFQCHLEADPLPFGDGEFTAVYLGQVLEHFTYSPRRPMQEIYRILKPGGLLMLDVPNVSELHNFYRLIRGKNILYDYKKHYLDAEPILYKGLPYFDRHNREFTAEDLRVLADTCGFQVVRIAYLRSLRSGKRGLRRLEVPLSALRDLIPLFRKTLMMVARKPLP